MEINDQIIAQFVIESRYLSRRSLYNYKTELKHFFNRINIPFDQIKSKDIRKWMTDLNEAKYKTSTIATNFIIVCSFYKYCTEENLVKTDPTANINKPVVEDKLPYYLSIEQLDKLRDLVKNNAMERAMVETFYSTGVRVSELVNIKISDIDWYGKKLIIMGKEKKERIVFFTYQCEAILKEYLSTRNDPNPYLFGKVAKKKISREKVERIFRGYRELLGFYLTPHTMRHTFAAHLAEKGMSLRCIQTLLGHDTIKATKIYARLYKHARKMEYDRFH